MRPRRNARLPARTASRPFQVAVEGNAVIEEIADPRRVASSRDAEVPAASSTIPPADRDGVGGRAPRRCRSSAHRGREWPPCAQAVDAPLAKRRRRDQT